jgi:hypothetical protein
MSNHMRLVWVTSVATCVLAAACGGQEAAPVPPPQAIAGPWAYSEVDGPTPAGMQILADQCLTSPLPLDADGEPDCVFIRAVYPHGTASAAEVSACQACGAPGQAAVPSSVPLTSVSTDLAGFDCLCAVQALPAGAACPPSGGFTAASSAAWCYTAAQATCGATATAAIVYSPAASLSAALYGACFTAGTFPVVEAQ